MVSQNGISGAVIGAGDSAMFVQAIAGLVHTEPKMLEMRDGTQVAIVDGKVWGFGEKREFTPDAIHVSTLTAIRDAMQNMTFEPGVLIHVLNPTTVQIIAPNVGREKQTFCYVYSSASVPSLNAGSYMDVESFIVALLTKFGDTSERKRILDYVAELKGGLLAEIVDNGVNQVTTTRRGITRAGQDSFENPVSLSPYRTFPEVDQPFSPFVLRLRQQQNGDQITAQAALFESDGGAWQADAIKNIGEWLREELPDATILA